MLRSNSTAADKKPSSVTVIHADGSPPEIVPPLPAADGTGDKAEPTISAMRIAISREFKAAIDEWLKANDMSLAGLLRHAVADRIGYTLPPEVDGGHRTRSSNGSRFAGMTKEQKEHEKRVGWRVDQAYATAYPKMVANLVATGQPLTTALLDAKAAELRKALEEKTRAKMATEVKK